MKFFAFLAGLFKSLFCCSKTAEPVKKTAEETYEVFEEDVINDEVVEETSDECCFECECGECECVTLVTEYPKILDTINWEELTKEDIDNLNKLDLNNICDNAINWYTISKFKGLPDDFIRKYKHMIIWSEYNKSYLKKATKEMLRAEGYLPNTSK